MSRQHHVIELTWDDDKLLSEGVQGVVDGWPVSGQTAHSLLAELASGWAKDAKARDPSPMRAAVYRCSFCGKHPAHVQRIVEGPGGLHACNKCIELVHGMLTERA